MYLQNIAQELTKDEKLAEKIAAEELREATKFLEDIEKKYEPSFFSGFKLPFRLPFFG